MPRTRMLKFLHRQQLVKKGLACGKSRRKVENSPLREALACGWLPRVVVFVAFAVGLGFLIFSGGAQEEPLKKFLICLLVFAISIAQLWINHPQAFYRNSSLALIYFILLLQLGTIKGLLVLADTGRIDLQLVPMLIPYAFAPLVFSVLLGRHLGLFGAMVVSLWGAFLMPVIDTVFLVISLISGAVAVLCTLQVRRRGQLVRAGLYVGLSVWLLAAIFGQIGPAIITAPQLTDWAMVGWQTLAAFGVGVGTAVLVSGILPVLEHIFGITTDISWLESADLNHPLLKRMTLEAPGTYHHSLAVANLAEAGAEAIGANPTMCRVCSYFHDIGKLVKPEYFTENMAPGENPHDDLAPSMSSLIIISHVKEGVDLALKHQLNDRVVDVIREHHGNSLVRFFHDRALKQAEDARLGGKIMNLRAEDVPAVREENFRYPGPNPQTRESGIVCLADAVESASRALKHPTPQRVEDLVDEVIERKMDEGLLDECPLTLDDIRKLGASFRFTLLNMMHSRIAYPQDDEAPVKSDAQRKATA
ncbi:MAG: HDIG domain-containing protein [Chthoniobacterales bacterium]|nr:HDIG domain-containing protein [Chthoniobacterales bacterium]